MHPKFSLDGRIAYILAEGMLVERYEETVPGLFALN